MISKYSHSIGIMSGTSLDGIDFAYVRFDRNNHTNFKIIAAKTYDYSELWRSKLRNAITFSKKELSKLDIVYGELLGITTKEFMEEYAIKEVEFIASHGHTVLHQPEKGITLQIGNGEILAKITQQKVVCDFRTQDVALGGQGAPLVPIGDRLLFSSYDFCINLGGFANVSYEVNEKRIAFDICPANIVLNHYIKDLGLAFDNKGEVARKGSVNETLLTALNELAFYKVLPPKSLGLEWVQAHIFPLINSLETETSIILRTFVEHIAIQIGNIITKQSKVLVTGGGTFNTFLMERIQYYSELKIEIPSKKLINYKEALVFAFLGLLRIDNQVNCLSSVTGAQKNHSSGVIFCP